VGEQGVRAVEEYVFVHSSALLMSAAGDLSKDFMGKTSDKAKGWNSTFGAEPLALSPVHIGAGSLCGGIRSLCFVAIHELSANDICSMLPRLTTLTTLDLSHNPLMDDAVASSISAHCTTPTHNADFHN
jgi:hypothetical protein